MNKSISGVNTLAKLAVVACLAVPLLPAAYAENAVTGPDAYTETVSLKGLDMTSAEGAKIALKRAEQVSVRICSHLETVKMDLSGSRSHTECIDGTYAGIVTQLDKVFGTDVVALSKEVNAEQTLALR